MKKLSAILATVTATLLLLAAPAAAESTHNTGTYGPAEEATWVFPLVALFVLICAVAAILGARTKKTDL